jgi:hypothetical protein
MLADLRQCWYFISQVVLALSLSGCLVADARAFLLAVGEIIHARHQGRSRVAPPIMATSRESRQFFFLLCGSKPGATMQYTWMLLVLLMPVLAAADAYECAVTRKVHIENEYTEAHLKQGQFSVKIEENEEGAYLSRCSFVLSQGKVTCDHYKVDKVVQDPYIKVKKYYVFASQFDVQLFDNMTFVENNGRADIAFGKCKRLVKNIPKTGG